MTKILENIAKLVRALRVGEPTPERSLPEIQPPHASLVSIFQANGASLESLKTQAKLSLAMMDHTELKFLEFIVRGWSHYDISEALGCTVEDVDGKSRYMMEKLKVSGESDLFRIGIYADLDSEG